MSMAISMRIRNFPRYELKRVWETMRSGRLARWTAKAICRCELALKYIRYEDKNGHEKTN